jgi:hypothetical protein
MLPSQPRRWLSSGLSHFPTKLGRGSDLPNTKYRRPDAYLVLMALRFSMRGPSDPDDRGQLIDSCLCSVHDCFLVRPWNLPLRLSGLSVG